MKRSATIMNSKQHPGNNLQPGPRRRTSVMITMWMVVLVTLSSSVASFSPTLANAHHHAPVTSTSTSNRQGGVQPLHVASTSAAGSFANEMMSWASSAVAAPASRTKARRRAAAPTIAVVDKSEYEKRKREWADRYTNLDSLREIFGANRNKVWGDLDAATARRLYKTLLPKALMELAKVGVEPEDLAPLAYQARVAAKLYARERCQVPARVGAQLFDGFRNFKRYGKFQTKGMSYQQIWEKYHKAIMEDAEEGSGLTEEDVTAKICLKILERSCSTNESVDRWVLPPEDEEQRQDLAHITERLEHDVRKLLLPVAEVQKENKKNLNIQKYRTLRLIAHATKRRRNHSLAEDRENPTVNKQCTSLSCAPKTTLAYNGETNKPWNQRQSKLDRRNRLFDRLPRGQ